MAVTTWGSKTIALFTFEIITCLVLLASLYLTARFKWTQNERKDTVRTVGCVVATITAICYFITSLVSPGISKSNANGYLILIIFSQLFSRIAEFAILAVTVRTVHRSLVNNVESSSSLKVVHGLTLIVLMMTGLASLVSFGLYTVYCSFTMSGRYSYGRLLSATVNTQIAYCALHVLCGLLVLVMAVSATVRERSKATLLMLFVTICLNVRTILFLVTITVVAYAQVSNDLLWASSFIYVFSTIAIYLGVALVAVMQPYSLPSPKYGVADQPIHTSYVADPAPHNAPQVYS